MPHDYPPPVGRLIQLGEPEFGHTRWLDYPQSLGLGAEHVPALIHMLQDRELAEAPDDSPMAYAVVHAWRALGQLRAEAALPALLDVIRSAHPDDDWVTEDLPTVFEGIGPAAFEPLLGVFRDRTLADQVRGRAAAGFTDVACAAPGLREQAVGALTRALDAYTPESADLHVNIIGDLLHLDALESLPSIRRAFDEERVDTYLMDWEEVEVHFGLKKRRTQPLAAVRRPARRAQAPALEDEWPDDPDFLVSGLAAPAGARAKDRERERARKKMAKKSRKQNRRK